jgi:hypothetical protein
LFLIRKKKNSNLARRALGAQGAGDGFAYISILIFNLISTNKINLKLHSILKSLYTRE